MAQTDKNLRSMDQVKGGVYDGHELDGMDQKMKKFDEILQYLSTPF